MEKLKSMGWLLVFYTTLRFVSDIGANSFAHFQFGTSISDKDKYLSRIVGGGGGGGRRKGEWTVESTPINIREYFKNGLQHGFEIF